MPGEGWAAGDLALCVTDSCGLWRSLCSGLLGEGPRGGQICTVARVVRHSDQETALVFAEFPGRTYPAQHFRRIAPHAPDAEDFATIRLMTGATARERV